MAWFRYLHIIMRFFLTIFASLFLSGCFSLDIDENRSTQLKTIEKTDPKWQQHLNQIKQIKSYQAEGQLGYIGNKKRFSGRFIWQYQNATNYKLTLYSTLISTNLTIQMTENGTIIADNKGRQRYVKDAKNLTGEMLGMHIPLEYLADWLKGQPNQQIDYQVGENHYLASFSYPVDQDMWKINYLVYHQNKSPALPKDILLKNAKQTLKIRIDSWQY